MKVTVVGCSGTFPGPDSPCSSYLFEHEGFSLLVDAGNGAIGNLQRFTGLLDVDAVALSHMHGDHYLDLVTYTYARRYHPDGEPSRLPVYGPPDAGAHVAGAFGRPVGDLIDRVYKFHNFCDGGRTEIGPFTLDSVRVTHPVETFAMRISAGGRTVGYSADTGPCTPLVEVARGCDLLLCEASYQDGDDNPPDIHLTGVEAGEAAAAAGVGRLVLTHLVPWGDAERSMAEAASSFDGPLERARTGAIYDL